MNNPIAHLSVFLMIFIGCGTSDSLTEYSDITIYRDQWGVPHIHAPTDEQVAYGLAWATAEDDFNTIQEQMLALNGLYGAYKGKEGIVADFAIHFMDIMDQATEQYQDVLSEKMLKVISAYADGMNAYAYTHPDEVYDHDLFPIGPENVVAGYMLGLVEISGAASDLQKIMNGKIIADLKSNFPKGSNAIAISNVRTVEEETFLAINSHQPLEGWYSWYEAHLISDEGQNILGGTFPGGATIFHGTNEHLGWAHTVNHADFSDVYKLDIDPNDQLRYRVDDQWYTLEEESIWAWMKVAGLIKIPIKRKKYTSIFGPTFITDAGTYAWRFAAHDAVSAVEQWYKMGRAESIDQFKQALQMQAIPCTNIVYADADHNIMYLSNARLPQRPKGYNWREVLPGNDRSLLWQDVVPLDSLPQVNNPPSGYVFNTNNTPFSSTDSIHNPVYRGHVHSDYGYQTPDLQNNRSLRFIELIDHYDQLTYDDFKTIKYDVQYPSELRQPHIMNLEMVLQLDPSVYPDIQESISMLNHWNRRCDQENKTAPLFLLTLHLINTSLKETGRYERGGKITAEDAVEAITMASNELIKVHGKIAVPLSEVMRHTRGKVDLPLNGGSDVLAAIYGSPQEDGTYRVTAGESYIQMVRFRTNQLPIIETVNAYGSSAKPDSPHYTDQMELFASQKLKPMTLSLEEVKKHSTHSYHPLKVQ